MTKVCPNCTNVFAWDGKVEPRRCPYCGYTFGQPIGKPTQQTNGDSRNRRGNSH